MLASDCACTWKESVSGWYSFLCIARVPWTAGLECETEVATVCKGFLRLTVSGGRPSWSLGDILSKALHDGMPNCACLGQ